MASQASHLAQYFLETRNPDNLTASSQSLITQIQHRLKLVSFWDIQPGSRVLEIGCGQGDCTIVLADAVGEAGHVDAVDPGAPDYGSPFTLSQAQAHISSTPLGPRITFHNSMPDTYISRYTGPAYDYIILSHSIYYFSSPSILPSLVTSLLALPAPTTLCIAEWSLRSRTASAFPHILTALLLSHLESQRGSESRGNIRTVLSPAQISYAVTAAGGFKVERERVMETDEGMRDAYWEVRDMVKRIEGGKLLSGIEGLGEAEKTVVGAMGDAVVSAVEGIGGVEGVRCMNVWGGVFSRV